METLSVTVNISLVNHIAAFINEAGIECRPGTIPGTTFLPGIAIQNGCIIYDPQRIKYPGDLLHEAGHLAVLLPQHRQLAHGSDNLSGNLDPAAAEMAAIAWSWAAKEHLGIAPEILFHEGGYQGDSRSIIENFSNGRYIGVPMLQWLGMTKEPKPGSIAGDHTYPKLITWLRQPDRSDSAYLKYFIII